MTTMTQCRLVRTDGAQQVAYIDSRRAQEGRRLRIRVDGVWEEGWRVQAAFPGSTMAAEDVAKRERDFKTHRKGTDI